MTKHAQNFLQMQIRSAGMKKMAVRFTMNEKLLSLSLFRESPKGYKLLQKIFRLPSKRTLNRLSERVCFQPGINKEIFSYLQKIVENWDTKKRLCSIAFDEVALASSLHFVESKDEIEGFVDNGSERKLRYCDHALVIMIRGICSSWRQPIAYYFCEGTISADDLQVILKEIVQNITEAALIPLAFVCDQGQTFRKALKNLKIETRRNRILQGEHDGNLLSIIMESYLNYVKLI